MPHEPATQPLVDPTDRPGDAVSFAALPLRVLALTGSGLAMGVVGALQRAAIRRASPAPR